MISRFGYFTRETVISLRRNLMMTIAGIITVMISLLLFGGIMLIARTFDHGTAKWKNGVELEIFMNVKASPAQVEELRAQLDNDKDLVQSYRFLSHQDAYEEFKRIFRDQPALIESTTPEVLPESFRVVPVRNELTEEVKNKYETAPGVQQVVTAQEQVKRILRAIQFVKYIIWGMAAALLASSLFLIVNTIRLATFARRREIEVMKLVGASNWFVRVPFMAEGIVQGVIGAGLAVGVIWALKNLISNVLKNRQDLFQSFYVTSADAFGIGVLVLLIGFLIGLIGSTIGLRKFLDA